MCLIKQKPLQQERTDFTPEMVQACRNRLRTQGISLKKEHQTVDEAWNALPELIELSISKQSQDSAG